MIVPAPRQQHVPIKFSKVDRENPIRVPVIFPFSRLDVCCPIAYMLEQYLELLRLEQNSVYLYVHFYMFCYGTLVLGY